MKRGLALRQRMDHYAVNTRAVKVLKMTLLTDFEVTVRATIRMDASALIAIARRSDQSFEQRSALQCALFAASRSAERG